MSDQPKMLEELMAAADQAYYGMTREEWFAKCTKDAEDWYATHSFRLPLNPVAGEGFSEQKIPREFSTVAYLEDHDK